MLYLFEKKTIVKRFKFKVYTMSEQKLCAYELFE